MKGCIKRIICMVMSIVMLCPGIFVENVQAASIVERQSDDAGINVVSETSEEHLADKEVIQYGMYPQSKVKDEELLKKLDSLEANANEKIYYGDYIYHKTDKEVYYLYEPIEWYVINEDNGYLTLLSKKIIDGKVMVSSWATNPWETSTLRSWLNSDFINAAFSNKEKKNIVWTDLENNRGNATTDKVFILSRDDYSSEIYGFYDDNDRKAASTDYAEGNSYYYWIRYSWTAFFGYWYGINPSGGLTTTIFPDSACGVRPAMRVKSSSFIDYYAEADSRYYTELKSDRITVYENRNDSLDNKDDFMLSEGAMVVVGNDTCITKADGNATFEIVKEGVFTVVKENYISRTLSLEQISENKEVYLQKKNSKAPVISGVWLGNTDVLYFPYTLNMLSTDKITLEAEVDWGSSGYGSIKLVQDAKSVSFSEESLTSVISDNFDTSRTIYIVATDAVGNTTKRPIKLQNSSVNKAVKWLDGAQLDFSDEISIKLPNNMQPSFLAGMKIGAGIVSTNIPVTVSAENGKASIIFGMKLNGKSYRKTTYKNGGSYTKTEVTNIIKDFRESGLFSTEGLKDSIKNFKNLKKLYNKQINTYKGQFGVDADFNVMGFAEATYDETGNIKFLDGGIIVNPSVSVKKDFPISVPVGPVVIPLFFETAFTGELEAQMNLLMSKMAKQFSPEGELRGEVALSGGVGLGVKKVFYASGGLEGKLNPLWKIYYDEDDYFKLTASLSGYAKVGIICFEGKLPVPLVKDAVWFETKAGKTLSEDRANFTNGAIDYASLYDTSNYKLKDLSYVEEGSEFVANADADTGRISTFVLKEELSERIKVNEFKTNIYKESTPKIISLDGQKKLAVWVDTASKDINHVYLYYSYFDGSVWSSPKIVYEDGTMDYFPELVRVGDVAYLAWQNAREEYMASDDLTLEALADGFDISVASFDERTKQFTSETITFTGLDMSPQICGEGEKVYVAWINNAENDWFGDNQKNNIMYSTLTESGWSSPVTQYENLYSIDSIAVDYQNGLKIAYCLDTDGNIETSDDLRIYENGTLVRNSSYAQSLPQYVDHELYWYGQNNVFSKEITEEIGNIAVENYQVLNVNGQKALIYKIGEGLNSKIMMSYLNTDTYSWDEGIQITDGNDFVGAYHATVDDSNVTILLNSAEIIGDYTNVNPYGKSRLMVVEIPEYYDLSLEEVYYAEDAFCAGEKMPFIIDLANEGTAVIDEVTVTIKDVSGNILNTMLIQDIIAPGEILETQVHYEIEKNVTEQTIAISAVPSDFVDANEENNEKELDLAFERVFVENLNWGYKEDEKVVISADIVNRGYHTRNNLLVSLIKDSVDGEAIETKEVSYVEPLDLVTVSFEVDATESDVYHVVIKQKSDKKILDQDFVVIYSDMTGMRVIRISGEDRYSTGYKVANMYKEELGVDKFDTVIVATGKNFADALAGSYLAAEKKAPILLTNGKSNNISELHKYIKANVNANGTIYILGGESAIPASVEIISGYTIKRLAGKNRYDTNIKILEEVGIIGNEIIVATGKSFADSLSASATKLPILLVKPNDILNDAQKRILGNVSKIYIVGGEGAVSKAYEKELKAYGEIERVEGKSRYETSVAIANEFFDDVNAVVLASGKTFPDGLCGGPFASIMGIPLILTTDKKASITSDYIRTEGIGLGYVLGGKSALEDETVVNIFGLENADEIITYVDKQLEIEEGKNQDPIGGFEWADGFLHVFYVNGWAEDPDTPDQPVEVRVYVDGEYVMSLMANTDCDDWGGCGCDQDHGFVEEISYHVTEQREYKISIYAVDTQSGEEVLIGEQQEIIYVDTTDPKVTNVTVSEVSETGYTITCTVTDNTRVERVRFFTWKAEEGMDFDGGAYPSDWETGAEYLGTINGNQVTFRVNIPENVSGETQLYRTDIYASDIYGRTKYVPVVASLGGEVFAPLKTITYGGNTYAVYGVPAKMCEATVPWSYAKTYAESIGGHLVTITSEEEWQAMMPLLEEARCDVWLGATDEEETGNWKWITGEVFSYSEWETGYPKMDAYYKENYLMVNHATTKWIQERNPLWLEANNFIVEFEGN